MAALRYGSSFALMGAVTRDDAIKLARLQKIGHRSAPPLLSQLAMLDGLKAGYSQSETGRTFGVDRVTVFNLKKFGPRWSQPLPSGFEMVVNRNR